MDGRDKRKDNGNCNISRFSIRKHLTFIGEAASTS